MRKLRSGRPAAPNLIHLVENIDTVQRIDTAAETTALAPLGMNGGQVERIWRAARKLYRSGTQPFISLGVWRQGECVMKRSIGHLSGNAPGEWGTHGGSEAVVGTPDAPVCLFSASKAITAAMIHKLAEQGVIDLDAPIAHYVPEFRQKGKKRVTIAQLLAHRAGIPLVPGRDPDPAILFDWPGAVQMLCGAKPLHKAGKQVAYHAITGGFILGEVARRATGKELRVLLDETLRSPLGLTHFNYGLAAQDTDLAAKDAFTGKVPPWLLGRVAKRALGIDFHRVPEVSNDPRFTGAVIPAGNIFATADEVCRFYAMLLNGGRWNDQQLMAPETVRRLTREAAPRQWDRTLMIPVRFSEGMLLGETPAGLYGRHSQRSYGHLGFINILTWADPDRQLAVSLLTTGKPAVGPHLLSLVRVVNSINRIPVIN